MNNATLSDVTFLVEGCYIIYLLKSLILAIENHLVMAQNIAIVVIKIDPQTSRKLSVSVSNCTLKEKKGTTQ